MLAKLSSYKMPHIVFLAATDLNFRALLYSLGHRAACGRGAHDGSILRDLDTVGGGCLLNQIFSR